MPTTEVLSHLADFLQVLLAFVAIVVAPSTINALIERVRFKFVADCRLIRPLYVETPLRWHISIKTRSSRFQDFPMFVFPESQGNRVSAARARTSSDGGMVVTEAIDAGALKLSFERFYRGRVLNVSLSFDSPDLPAFYSEAGAIRRRLRVPAVFARGQPRVEIELIHRRIKYVMLVLLGVLLFVIARLFVLYYSAWL